MADGKLAAVRQTATGTNRFEAAHAEFAMLPEHNLLKDMTATGGVTGSSQQGKDSRMLKTDALRVTFAAALVSPGGGSANRSSSAEKQRIETVESLAPATVQSTGGDEVTELHAQRIVAQFDPNGRLDKLLGHSGVEVRRQAGRASAQTSSASELVATFGKDGDWDTLDESGDVQFTQADRHGSAAHAKMTRATDIISLNGKPEFEDATARTTAGSVTIDQKSNEIRGEGGIVSTYMPAQTVRPGSAVNIGSGAAHISSDTVSASSVSGHAVYSGHARLWQGDSILEADQIEVWRDEKKMQATGRVVAEFPQAASPLDASFGGPNGSPAKAHAGPTL